MRSATSNTSWRLCEITTTPSPCVLNRLMRARTCWDAPTPSAAVGSSRRTTFECHITALAMATACRWPPESPAILARTFCTVTTVRSRSVSSARRSICSSASTSTAGASRRAASRPRNMFWTASRLSQRARSWYTVSIPHRLASAGEWNLTSRPSNEIVPASGRYTPDMILTRVDFPAPLSPTSATTSAG